MEVIERIAEHYAVQETPFGRTYRWVPEQVMAACSKCGNKTTYKRSEIIASEVIRCECGKGSTAGIREKLVLQLLDREYEAQQHPWRYGHTTKDSGIPV